MNAGETGQVLQMLAFSGMILVSWTAQERRLPAPGYSAPLDVPRRSACGRGLPAVAASGSVPRAPGAPRRKEESCGAEMW
jgi:hypothetical protein